MSLCKYNQHHFEDFVWTHNIRINSSYGSMVFFWQIIKTGYPVINIWIVGHYITHWAFVRAISTCLGSCLGLPESFSVSWVTKCDMKWEEFMPIVMARAALHGPPKALIVQLGENDLGQRSGKDLAVSMMKDFDKLAALFPGLTLIWSEMLVRRHWQDFSRPRGINKTRRTINRRVAEKAQLLNGRVIRHPNITYKQEDLFHNDGVHLSDLGNDVWLADLIKGIKDWLQV
ncbi:uncharacterized protein LOC128420587 isoform X1 [Podarcis raffonei]|uniref:uncharacterized protein LOC128420587 isoform X1 n=1 Tax=Podarcis raffonei TaxID=65483 RepID=UPI0023299A9B|nr:uncharacterized protein LOC128420587 isoform X1 [Podarcis raffonei]